ncbi:hypothetical protein ACFPK9_15915 [Rubritalea spongiae]|uniref:Uncharacterized protein n=1 Tax=Rubritalea spongiae TaxID=430797 RepID=A0ABW5DZB7_9BACT
MSAFTPARYIEEVIQEIKNECRCAVPGFQKIISFNFEDYGISPTLLWDAEILIQHVIRDGDFVPMDEGIQRHGDSIRHFKCKSCGRICTETYTEYSINMYRSFVIFDEDLRSSKINYALGYRGFEQSDFDKITDFIKSTDDANYIANLTKLP